MGCLLVAIALMVPRILMVFILLLTDWFGRAYETAVWPVLGFFFMPYTTLAYLAARLNNGALSGGWLALFIAAIVVDASHWGGSGAAWRQR